MTDTTETPRQSFDESALARDMRDFAGRNADTMLRKMRRFLPPAADPASAAKQKRRRGGGASLIWPAAFITFIWFFYRRMYLEGAAFIILPILIVFLLPEAQAMNSIPGTIALLTGGWFYWKRADRRIAKADAQGLTGDARSAFLAAGGGVSVAGLVLGVILYAVLIGLFIVGVAMDPSAL
jgi:hypothetical protein